MLIPYLFKHSANALVCDSPGQLLPFWEGNVIGGLWGLPLDPLHSAGQSLKVWRTTQDVVQPGLKVGMPLASAHVPLAKAQSHHPSFPAREAGKRSPGVPRKRNWGWGIRPAPGSPRLDARAWLHSCYHPSSHWGSPHTSSRSLLLGQGLNQDCPN